MLSFHTDTQTHRHTHTHFHTMVRDAHLNEKERHVLTSRRRMRPDIPKHSHWRARQSLGALGGHQQNTTEAAGAAGAQEERREG